MIKPIWISILLCLLCGTGLFAQEIIFERYAKGTDFWLIIPYSSIKFRKGSDVSRYQVAVEIRDAKKKQVAGYSEIMAVPQRSWLENTAIPVNFSADLPSGKYTAEFRLRNLSLGDKVNSKRTFTLSDAYTKIGQAYLLASKDNVRFIPQGTANLSAPLDDLVLRQSYSILPDSIRVDLGEMTYLVTGETGMYQVSLLDTGSVAEAADLQVVFYDGNVRYRMDPFLYSPWFSYNVRYSPKDQIQQLRYISTQNEWQGLRALPDKQMEEGIEQFWLRHDPSPGTVRNEAREDFYRRVIRADEMFTVHKKLKGWTSDRGRIYIKYGDPDEILTDIHPLGIYPSIVWVYYHKNLEFVFVDSGGYGQYTLRNKDEEY